MNPERRKLPIEYLRMAEEILPTYKTEVKPEPGSNKCLFGRVNLKDLHSAVVSVLRDKGLSEHQATLVFSENSVTFIPEAGKNSCYYNAELIPVSGVVLESGVQLRVGQVLFEFNVDLKNQRCVVQNIEIMNSRPSNERIVSHDIELHKQTVAVIGKKIISELGLNASRVNDEHVALISSLNQTGGPQVNLLVQPGSKVTFYGHKQVLLLEGSHSSGDTHGSNRSVKNDEIRLQDGDVIGIGGHFFVFSETEWKLKYLKSE